MVDLFEGDEFVGEKTKGLASAPVGRPAGGESDEMSFVLAVEFAFVISVGVAAVHRRNPSVCVPFPCAIGRRHAADKGATDLGVSLAVVSFEQNPGSGDVFGPMNTAGDE